MTSEEVKESVFQDLLNEIKAMPENNALDACYKLNRAKGLSSSIGKNLKKILEDISFKYTKQFQDAGILRYTSNRDDFFHDPVLQSDFINWIHETYPDMKVTKVKITSKCLTENKVKPLF